MNDTPTNQTTGRSTLDQAKEAADLAQAAFASGDVVTGIAATSLAAQITQLARATQNRTAQR